MSNSPSYDNSSAPSFVWGDKTMNPQSSTTGSDSLLSQCTDKIAEAITTQGEAIVEAIENINYSSGMTEEEVNNLVDNTWNGESNHTEPSEAKPCECGCGSTDQDLTGEEVNSLVGNSWE